ncbi:acetyl-CoA carboxylase [Neisseria cinerea]|nr:acetyl-CoA carboxylase [Neisseria cinerea]MCD2070318.1 acetyl-CoA carboxylase [Neisseria cinerea]
MPRIPNRPPAYFRQKLLFFNILLDICRQLRENKHIITVVFRRWKNFSKPYSARFAPLPQAGCFLKNQRNSPPKSRQPLKEQKWICAN